MRGRVRGADDVESNTERSVKLETIPQRGRGQEDREDARRAAAARQRGERKNAARAGNDREREPATGACEVVADRLLTCFVLRSHRRRVRRHAGPENLASRRLARLGILRSDFGWKKRDDVGRAPSLETMAGRGCRRSSRPSRRRDSKRKRRPRPLRTRPLGRASLDAAGVTSATISWVLILSFRCRLLVRFVPGTDWVEAVVVPRTGSAVSRPPARRPGYGRCRAKATTSTRRLLRLHELGESPNMLPPRLDSTKLLARLDFQVQVGRTLRDMAAPVGYQTFCPVAQPSNVVGERWRC